MHAVSAGALAAGTVNFRDIMSLQAEELRKLQQEVDTVLAGRTPPLADLPNLPQDLVDTIVGMGDAFLLPEVVRDLQGLQGFVNQCSTAYRAGKILGFIEGGLPLALRGAAALATTQTRIGHWLNHGRYWRIGPGRMKAAGRGLPAGTHVPRLALGPDRPGVQHPHRDLRTRIPYVIPLGGTKCGCE